MKEYGRFPKAYLWREDFKHSVSLPCPHDGKEVRQWFHDNRIPFIYATHNVGKTVEYIMTEKSHAACFILRWL
jgi:hypothetical protein